MEYTEGDLAAELDQEREERIAAEGALLMDLGLDQEQRFTATFGTAAAGLNPQDRFAYLGWLSKHLEEAGALNKASTRLTICLALAGMPNYEVKDQDGPLAQAISRTGPIPVGYMEMLEAIVPPITDDIWGSYGRPKSLTHQTYRMTGNDKNGKSVNLITQHEGPEIPKGKAIEGVKLAPNGMCYAHIHAEGKVTKNDMVHYWLHITSGQEKPEATNPAYLALIGEGPVVEATPNQWVTPLAPWRFLHGLTEYDIQIPERYKDKSAVDLSRALVAVHGKDAARCLGFLHRDDQVDLFYGVMENVNVGSSKYAQAKILEDLDSGRTAEARVELLAHLWGLEHGEDDATTVIEELICRAAWVVVSRAMEYRVGVFIETQVDTDTALDLAQTQAQLLVLQRHVKELDSIFSQRAQRSSGL